MVTYFQVTFISLLISLTSRQGYSASIDYMNQDKTLKIITSERGGTLESVGTDADDKLKYLESLFDPHNLVGLPLEDRVNEGQKHITLKECVDYLEKYGYLVGEFRFLKEESLKHYIAPALKLFQHKMEIPLTGLCDERTKHEMAVPRCDFPDYMTKNSARGKRFILGNTKWSKEDLPLTIHFADHNKLMPKAEQEKAFMQAANRWASVSGLKFTTGNARNAKITIGFTNHDGPWGILGRAWFPKVGKILFERKESWVSDIPKKSSGGGNLSFFSVAMHELGHALGISHSNLKNAIMHGQYQRNVLELTADDVRAVQKLYGKSFLSGKDNGSSSKFTRRVKPASSGNNGKRKGASAPNNNRDKKNDNDNKNKGKKSNKNESNNRNRINGKRKLLPLPPVIRNGVPNGSVFVGR